MFRCEYGEVPEVRRSTPPQTPIVSLVGYVVGGVFGIIIATIRAGLLKRICIATVSPRLDSVPPHLVRSPEHVREAHQSHLRLQASGASSLGPPIHPGWQELLRLPAMRNGDRLQCR